MIQLPRLDDESELAMAYSALDIFLYTPLADNCPLVVLEAMSCGLPIVSFATGGVPELIRNGIDGWIIECTNRAQTAAAVENLIADPADSGGVWPTCPPESRRTIRTFQGCRTIPAIVRAGACGN